MAGMEGYFGPKEESFTQGIHPSARERWISSNEDYYGRKSNVRPTHIDVQPLPPQKYVNKPSPSEDEGKVWPSFFINFSNNLYISAGITEFM